jgi:hypothetical protein
MPDETKTGEPKAPKTEKVKETSLPAAVLALDGTPDGKTLFAACQDGSVFVVDAERASPSCWVGTKVMPAASPSCPVATP